MSAYNYIFKLSNSSDGTSIQSTPIYKNLQVTKTRQTPQMYFKKEVQTEMSFVGDDYAYLIGKPVSTKFFLDILDKKTGQNIISTHFRYVDMEIDITKRIAKAKLTVTDAYTKIVENLNTEYDLFRLNPAMVSIRYQFSKMFQITGVLSSEMCNVYGDSVVNKDAPPMTTQELAKEYKFSPKYAVSNVLLSLTENDVKTLAAPSSAAGAFSFPSAARYELKLTRYYDQGGIYIALINKFILSTFMIEDRFYWIEVWIAQVDKPTVDYYYSIYLANTDANGSTKVTLLSGEGFPENSRVDERNKVANLYANTRNDVEVGVVIPIISAMGTRMIKVQIEECFFDTLHSRLLTLDDGDFPLDTANDMFLYSNVYRQIIGFSIPYGGVVINNKLSDTPTPYGMVKETIGLAEEGRPPKYYDKPNGPDHYEPFAFANWGTSFSMWVNVTVIARTFFQYTYEVENRNFCSIGEAIRLLLREIDESIKFTPTTTSSEFLYGNSLMKLSSYSNPRQRLGLYLTQRSNANKPNSDNYAVRGKITLGQILDMLRCAFNIYWYIDGKTFRLEHIQWFLTNGSYKGTSGSIDLNAYKDRFNKRTFAFHTGNHSYDLSEEYSKSKLTWSLEASKPFNEGIAIMKDSFDDSNKQIENTISNITPDIEYCAAFGKDVSNDGFVVAACVTRGTDLVVDSPVVDGIQVVNGNFALEVLYKSWLCYFMPSKTFELNGKVIDVLLPRFVKHNSVTFPSAIPVSSEYTQIITEVGNGHITKATEDLDNKSVSVELYYDRE